MQITYVVNFETMEERTITVPNVDERKTGKKERIKKLLTTMPKALSATAGR